MAKTYSTPRRYDLATLMVVVAGYMLLFGGMRALYLIPFIQRWVGSIPFFWFAGLITLVGVGQAVLFRGSPRLVSISCGVVYCLVTFMWGPVWVFVSTGRWDYYAWPQFTLIVFAFATVGGAAMGYISGVCVGGVFLVADYFRRKLGWQSLESDDVDEGGSAATTSGDEVAQEGAEAHDVSEETHPLDRDWQVG